MVQARMVCERPSRPLHATGSASSPHPKLRGPARLRTCWRVRTETVLMEAMNLGQGPVRQLRVVIEAGDYESALTFFRDVLGMAPIASFSQREDAEVAILDAGRATLEVANSTHKRYIDEVEAEGQPSPWIRLALEVDDTQDATAQATAAGAQVVAEARLTPWHSVNSRLDLPAVPGLQLTLFAETIDQHTRDRLDGFTP